VSSWPSQKSSSTIKNQDSISLQPAPLFYSPYPVLEAQHLVYLTVRQCTIVSLHLTMTKKMKIISLSTAVGYFWNIALLGISAFALICHSIWHMRVRNSSMCCPSCGLLIIVDLSERRLRKEVPIGSGLDLRLHFIGCTSASLRSYRNRTFCLS
jgi:hypothetical protein